jgi:hypothetical protein
MARSGGNVDRKQSYLTRGGAREDAGKGDSARRGGEAGMGTARSLKKGGGSAWRLEVTASCCFAVKRAPRGRRRRGEGVCCRPEPVFFHGKRILRAASDPYALTTGPIPFAISVA